MGLSSVQSDHPYSRISADSSKHKGRLGILECSRPIRMEIAPSNISKNLQTLWDTRNRPICVKDIHQLPQYMSFKPDPQCKAVDAFQENWSHLFGYAFPPFNMVGRTLKKALKHKNLLLVVAPVWVSQPWYPILLEMLVLFSCHRESISCQAQRTKTTRC